MGVGVGGGTQRGARWLARVGSGVGLAVWVSFFWLEETMSFVPRSQRVSLWGWGEANSPLARRAWVGLRAPDSESGPSLRTERTLSGWRQGCLGSATTDKAASCGGAQPPGPWPPWPPSSPGAKPQQSPSHSGQCPPQLSCACHQCPGPAERRSASLGATPPRRPLHCSPPRR